MQNQVYAEQRILTPEGVEILNLPPHPRFWVMPRQGATSVKLLGIENPPEEFLKLAEAWGWRYLDGKFYPI